MFDVQWATRVGYQLLTGQRIFLRVEAVDFTALLEDRVD